MWNTLEGTSELVKTLQNNNYQHNYNIIVYENAGDPYYAPFIIPSTETELKLSPRHVLSTGGDLEDNAHTREDSWLKAIEFFKQ